MREKGKGTMEKEKFVPEREDKGLTASGQRGDRHGAQANGSL